MDRNGPFQNDRLRQAEPVIIRHASLNPLKFPILFFQSDPEGTIQNGYHDGTGTVSIDATEQAKIIAGNIKKDVEILGVTGTYEGSGTPTSVAKTVTPYTTSKTYTPSSESTPVDYYSQFTVNAISYTETDNAQGGKTVTIGDVAPA